MKAVALFVLAMVVVMLTNVASGYGNLFLVGEIAVEGRTAHAIIRTVGIVSETGIGAAGIILAVNPWLALGVGVMYGM